MPNAIVIVIDRLGAGYLGPYGNTWCETPAFNQLASECIVWENAFADSPTLKGFYRALQTGTHSLVHLPGPDDLIRQLNASGIHTVLISDDPEVDKLKFSESFVDRISVPSVGRQRAAESIDDTQAAHTFAAALACLEQLASPYFLWVHLRGMSDQWDAPRDFRERFADEEDPPPPDFVNPPDKLLPQDVDPDEVLGVNHAYAGQIALIDECLATWLEAFAKLPSHDETLLAVTSPRGYPLGERGGFGASTDGLHEEVLHVPLLLRVPGNQWRMRRSQALVYPSDLNPTLRRWFASDSAASVGVARDLLSMIEHRETQRDYIVSAFQEGRSLRTTAWFVTHVGDKPAECFVKPDDRWEVNEISSRRGDVVEQGLQALRAFEQGASEGRFEELPKLAQVLLEAPE